MAIYELFESGFVLSIVNVEKDVNSQRLPSEKMDGLLISLESHEIRNLSQPLELWDINLSRIRSGSSFERDQIGYFPNVNGINNLLKNALGTRIFE